MLVEAQKKADARKEELQTKNKQVEKLENVINDLQNKVRILLMCKSENRSQFDLALTY